ncbi:MAG: MarR family winged helix-turn-helix transcriptional regulator [Geminicoccales bacterium]
MEPTAPEPRPLVAKGLITNEPDPKDARKCCLFLTSEGRDICEEAMIICVEAEKAMPARLDDDERKALDSLLNKMPAQTSTGSAAGLRLSCGPTADFQNPRTRCRNRFSAGRYYQPFDLAVAVGGKFVLEKVI